MTTMRGVVMTYGLSEMRVSQLLRLADAERKDYDPDRTGVGRAALRFFQQSSLIRVKETSAGKRVRLLPDAHAIVAAAPKQVRA